MKRPAKAAAVLYPTIISILIIVIAVLAGCSGGGAGGETLNIPAPDSTVSVDTGSSYQVECLSNTGSFTYTSPTLLAGDEVYFIFTNYSSYDAQSYPTVYSSSASSANISSSLSAVPDRKDFQPPEPVALRGSEKITALYPEVCSSLTKSISGTSSSIYSYPVQTSQSLVGDTRTFHDNIPDPETLVSATLRGIVSGISTDFGTKNLEVWVENSFWGTGVGQIDQTKLDALTNAFLQSGLDNDIYDWVTGIFGEEWGSTGYSNLIGETDTIVILLHDINSDGVPSGSDSRIVGYFNPTHNFLTSTYSNSDECIRFSIDAALFAEMENSTWEITDFWPEECISTLAHEFQHMIHFYQKQIVNNVGFSDTWLNEMASLEAEDLVSYNIQINGPRGVAYSDGTAGSSGNTSGRLPLFNYWDDGPLTSWGAIGTLTSYSTAYSFGSFLARNFGGADLFGRIVRNAYTDENAVLDAISSSGLPDETFESLLVKWGVAVLLSDDASSLNSKDICYNQGNFISSSTGGHSYNLGSINLFNYTYDTCVGPYLYSGTGSLGYFKPKAASNLYYYAGTASGGGTDSWSVTLPAGVRMTVVVK